ncbi:MAG: hypothetical protein KF768_09945 [Phycisphaeraceae bacterium]|nr:hypothetical protein [Phycisphaeraceae bacterium]
MKTLRTHTARALAIGAASACASSALAQATVPFSPPVWADFGTTNIAGVAGNFLPGWTTLTGSPDLGKDLFFIPVQSLSGAPDDAALWFLKFDQSSPGFGSNESAELSLSGFTPGVQYRLDFFSTLVHSHFAFWNAQTDDLQVSIVGADVTTFSTTMMNDFVSHDSMNDWVPQSIVFTATAGVVSFRFNDAPVSVDPALAARIGVDGMRIAVVPAPGAGVLLGLGGLVVMRRRRR